ncbi:hypothetical protein ABIC03_007675, partial [Bradyrhizobium sp. RT6a]|uniref:hypothetical protein n=1 Tax=Bradyrhizobium sp. RT6a TaxID=3156381 RepID=UPI00339A80D9
NDKGAVHAAITQPWSNGQVEAQITKLKLVKRQMYGRAKLDLLQARLIGAIKTITIIEYASEPRLDADHPENGVLIPCRNTIERRFHTSFLPYGNPVFMLDAEKPDPRGLPALMWPRSSRR